jgi:hypothetical protein
LILRASPLESEPSLRRKRICSRQSSRESLAVEATRKPAGCQSVKITSVGERGGAEVTAATTTSAESSQRRRTGRILDALPSVKGISASQIAPGDGVIVKPFVCGSVAVQKCAVAARGLNLTLAVNPVGQFRKIFRPKFFNCVFNFLNFAHVEKLQPTVARGKFIFLPHHRAPRMAKIIATIPIVASTATAGQSLLCAQALPKTKMPPSQTHSG